MYLSIYIESLGHIMAKYMTPPLNVRVRRHKLHTWMPTIDTACIKLKIWTNKCTITLIHVI